MIRRHRALSTVLAMLLIAAASALVAGPSAGASAPSADAADLWVSDFVGVLRFDAGSGQPTGRNVAPGDGGLSNAQGIEVGPDGLLYVSSFETREVLRYSAASGAFVDVFVPAGTGGLGAPNDVTFGPDGNLYVADGFFGTNGVVRYDGRSGAFIDLFASGGGLRNPNRLTFDHRGDLFVANANTSEVLRFDGVTGAALPASGQPGAVFVAGEVGPFNTTLAFDADGDLYVGSGATFDIDRYDGLSGAPLGTFVPGGAIGDLTFGPDGDLYVNDYLGRQVLRYDGETGDLIGPFVTPRSGGLGRPSGLAFGTAGTGPCGTITSSIRLSRNTTCDIRVVSSGVTIDLGGRRLTGDITTSPDVAGVVVRNGEVRGTIDLGESVDGKIDRVTVRDGGAIAGEGTTVLRSRFVSSPDVGLLIERSHVEVRSSTFERGNEGIAIGGGHDILVNGVTVRDNGYIGIAVDDACRDGGPNDVEIKNSKFERNAHGVVLHRCGGGLNGSIVVQRNSFLRHPGSGLILELDSAPAPGTQILIRSNRFIGNGRGGSDVFDDGISSVLEVDFGEYAPHSLEGDDVTIRGNVAVSNQDLGIHAEGAIDGGGNTARKNGDPRQCVGVVCRR